MVLYVAVMSTQLVAGLDGTLRAQTPGQEGLTTHLPGSNSSAGSLDGRKDDPRALKAADFFKTSNIATLHIQFTPEAWEALEPKDSGRGPFGGFGRPGGPGGPGGPGPPINHPGRFGPEALLAPIFVKQGDQDKDGKLSRQELLALSEKWFLEWDKEMTGTLTGDQLRAGINSILAATDRGAPSSGPTGGGPTGGPQGRGPGLNLQGPEGKRNGLASAMGIEFSSVRADMEIDGRHFTDVAVRFKGNGTFLESRRSLKRSFKIDFDKFVKGQHLADISKINLHNNVTDASWMNEVLSYRLYRDAGVPAPRTAYARVYVTVQGKYERRYAGLYSLVEDVDDIFAKDRFGTRKGAIFKPVTPNLFGDLGSDWAKYKQTYDPKTTVSFEDAQRIMELCRLVTSADDPLFAAKLGEYVDLDELARFLAVMVFLSDLDGILGPGQNLYLHLHPKTRKLVFIPWDQDHSFGQFAMRGSQEQRENLSIHRPWQGENHFLERVFKLEEFKKLYLARLEEFTKSIFKPERFHEQVDEIAQAIRPAVEEEARDMLARFDKAVSGEAAGPTGAGGPGGFPFFEPPKPIKPFVSIRARSVEDQVAGKAEGQILGEFGFGGRGRPGERGGPRGRGPGGPGGFGAGNFLAPAVTAALDADKDGRVTHEELTQGFTRWFEAWDTDKSGILTDEELRAGIGKELSPPLGGPPRDRGFERPVGSEIRSGPDISGIIEANTTWYATKSPYMLSGAVTVKNGVTLTIEPGAAVYLGSNVDLQIADGGRLLAQGTAEAPIRFTSPPSSKTRWGGIIVNGTEGSPETRISHAYFEGNNFSAIYSPGGTLLLDHVTFGSTDRQYLSLDDSSFLISSCYFPTTTGAFEPLHGSQGLKRGGRAVFRECFFGNTSGYSDIIDFTGGNRDRNQPIIQFYNNVFSGGSDDLIDLDGTDAWIEGNIFLHAHKNGTPDTSSAISGGNRRRFTSEVTIIGNLFFDCDHAATAKQGNFFTMINNTIVHMTKTGGEDTASGALCVRDLDPFPTTFGEGYYMEGNIIVDIEQLVRNYQKEKTTVTFNNNILPYAWDGPGSENSVVDPKLKHIPQLRETYFTTWTDAQILREWFSLLPDSPAIGTGPNGRDKGGVIPLGALICGEPAGTTDQTTATLRVGVNRKGHGIPVRGWPDGAGYTHYKWRLDAGQWSEETPIDNCISLSNLGDGSHQVEVIAKRDSGWYQNDPALGSDAVVTRSRTWTVERKK
jgi:spore coat protein CotH